MEKNEMKENSGKNVVIVVPNLVCGAINVHTAARKKMGEKNNFKYHARR